MILNYLETTETFFKLTKEWSSTGDILQVTDSMSPIQNNHINSETTKSYQLPLIPTLLPQYVRQESEELMKNLQEDLRKLGPKKRAKKREEITTQSLFSRCEEIKLKEDFNDEERLDRGDFLIARICWDITLEKYHDHWTIVKERYI